MKMILYIFKYIGTLVYYIPTISNSPQSDKHFVWRWRGNKIRDFDKMKNRVFVIILNFKIVPLILFTYIKK